MPTFSIDIEPKTEQDKLKAIEFFNETNKRLIEDKNFVTNPYKDSKIIFDKDTRFVAIMKPIYFKIYYIGLIVLVMEVLMVREWWSWWYIIGLTMMGSYIFYNKLLYYFIICIALRKKGYHGKILLD